MSISLFEKTMQDKVKFDMVKDAILNNKDILVKYVDELPTHTKETPVTPIDVNEHGDITIQYDGDIYTSKLEWLEEVLNETMALQYIPRPEEEEKTEKEKTKEKESEYTNNKDFMELVKKYKTPKKISNAIKRAKEIDYSHCKTLNSLYLELKADRMLEGLSSEQFGVLSSMGFSLEEEIDFEGYTIALIKLSDMVANMVGAKYQIGIQKEGYEFTKFSDQTLDDIKVDKLPIKIAREFLSILDKWYDEYGKLAIGTVSQKKYDQYKSILQKRGYTIKDTQLNNVFRIER